MLELVSTCHEYHPNWGTGWFLHLNYWFLYLWDKWQPMYAIVHLPFSCFLAFIFSFCHSLFFSYINHTQSCPRMLSFASHCEVFPLRYPLLSKIAPNLSLLEKTRVFSQEGANTGNIVDLMREKLKTKQTKVVNNLSVFVFFLAPKLIFHKEGAGNGDMVDLIWEKLKMDNAKANANAANAKIKFVPPLFFIYFWAQSPWWDTNTRYYWYHNITVFMLQLHP